jgi:DNA polymerase I
VQFCYQRGYVESMYGRKRRIPEIWSTNKGARGLAERQALNSPLQTGASEMVNRALVRAHERIRSEGLRGFLINTVHDSLVATAPAEESEYFAQLIKEEMERKPFAAFNVPLVAEVGVSDRWGGELKLDKVRAIGRKDD